MSSQADALLSSMTESNAELGDATLGTMVLGTSAYDSGDIEEHIVIGSNRYIIVPDALKRIAVQHDNGVETVTFDCPRYWDEHDMSEMKIYINYIRADNEPGSYPVDNDVTIDEDDPTIMHFGWTIRRELTEVHGNITFLVCIKAVDDEGNENEHWNSELCTDMYVSKGLEVHETVINRYPDLITHLLVRMDVVEEKTTLQSMLGYLDEYFATDASINDVLLHYVEDYLQNDEEVTLTITSAINEYIAENLTTTDETLSVSGMPADGAATGTAIANTIRKIDSTIGVVLNNSKKGALRINRVFGKSTQVTTTGAQLFDASKLESATQGGATVTNNGDGSFTVSGSGTLSDGFHVKNVYTNEETLKFLKSGTLRINFGNSTLPYCYVALIDSSGNNLMEISNRSLTSSSYDITGELLLTDGLYMVIGFYGSSSSTITPGTFKPMLYFDGDSDGTWEPYTGGMASPNPEYPQEIVNVGADDGVVETEVYGKNLLNINRSPGTTVTKEGVTAVYLDDGGVKVSGTPASAYTAFYYNNTLTLPPGNYIVSGGSMAELVYCQIALTHNDTTTYHYPNNPNFTVAEGDTLYCTLQTGTNTTDAINATIYPMIRLADCEDGTWEPYKPKQSLTIDTPNGLPGIPVTDESLANYTDENGQMWCCDERDWARGVDVQRVRSLALSNFESSAWIRSSGWANTSAFYTGTSYYHTYTGYYSLADMYCNRLSIATPDAIASSSTNAIGLGGASVSNSIYVSVDGITDADSLAAYFAENDTIIHYILATPIETPIPEEEMAAWRAMQANEPTTTILSDAEVEVEYPTSRVGAVALDADMRSREVEETTFRRYPLTRVMAEQGWTNDDIMAMNVIDIVKVMEDCSVVYFAFNSTTNLCADLPNVGGTNKGCCEITRLNSTRIIVNVDIQAAGKYVAFIDRLVGANYEFIKLVSENDIGSVAYKDTQGRFSQMQMFMLDVIPDSSSYANAPVVVQNTGETATTNGNRAGIGFHNHGLNGAYLYYDAGGVYKFITHEGKIRTLIDDTDITVVSLPFVEIGIDDYTTVYASVSMTKIGGDKANIVINYQIVENTKSSSVYKFIDISKLATALSLGGISFQPPQTTVILQPCISVSGETLVETTSYATAELRGYTGLMFDVYGGLGRIWGITDGEYGPWALDISVYLPGTYGTITINGATIS